MHRQHLRDRPLDAYESIVGQDRIERIRDLAECLADVRILHVNSTAHGGGVAELLTSHVPVANGAGVDTDWAVLDADSEFFEFTKALHDGLQGRRATLDEDMVSIYRRTIEENATLWLEDGGFDPYDVVVLHDPQPLGLVELIREHAPETGVLWRCHVDLTDPAAEYRRFVRSRLDDVDDVVVSLAEYGSTLDRSVHTIHPSIDPLTTKNRELNRKTTHVEVDRLAAVPFDDAPVVTQVARFDRWKDQPGVLAAHRLLGRRVPGVQLVLVGGMADDDPGGPRTYERVVAESADNENVHLLTDLPNAGVNLLQRRSDVVLQKSIREGFGLTVSEALWKQTPVVGSNVGGIPLQIIDGENGYLVDPTDLEAVADRTAALLEDEETRRRYGRRGREHVRERFLLPRQLREWFEFLEEVL